MDDYYFSTFIQMLRVRGLADNTVRSYKTYIRPYLWFLSGLRVDELCHLTPTSSTRSMSAALRTGRTATCPCLTRSGG